MHFTLKTVLVGLTVFLLVGMFVCMLTYLGVFTALVL